MTIKEFAYSGLSKNPSTIATYLIQQHKKANSAYSVLGLQGGIQVDIGSLGLSLAMSNRRVIFKTSVILFKHKYLLFITGKDKILVFKMKNIKWEQIKTRVKPFPVPTNKLRLTLATTFFSSLGIVSGGVKAFFALIKKLDNSNMQASMKKVLAPAAVIVNKQYIPFAIFRAVDKMPSIGADTQEKEMVVAPKEIKQGILKRPAVELFQPKKTVTKVTFNGTPVALKISVNKNLTNKLKSIGLSETSAKEEVRESVDGWASSATSSSSIDLQTAAANLAKIKPEEVTESFIKSYCRIEDGVWRPKTLTFSATDAKISSAIAKATYESTQRWLEIKKIRYLRVFRGMDLDKKYTGKSTTSVEQRPIKLNPLSSFTTSVSIAQDFGSHIVGCIAPKERIFSCPATGHGCKNEKEFVLLGGLITAWFLDFNALYKKYNGLRDECDKLKNLEFSAKLSSQVQEPLTPEEETQYEKLTKKADATGFSDSEYKEYFKLRTKKNAYEKYLKATKTVFTNEQKERLTKLNNLLTQFSSAISLSEAMMIAAMGKSKLEVSGAGEPIEIDDGDNANWIKKGLDTGSLPLIGTPEFQDLLIKKSITFEDAMKMPAYHLASIKSVTVIKLLNRFASSLKEGTPKQPTKMLEETNKSLCHLTTVKGIKERRDRSDKIWMFGHTEKTGHQVVFHSLLTDRHNKIVANNYAGAGNQISNFDPTQGYKSPAGEYIPVIAVVSVGEFFKKFFRVAPK